MKKVIREIIPAIFLAILASALIVIVFYSFVPNQYETNYVSSMWDKYTRLMSIDEPKVVLVGDSNLAFGIDSAYIEEKTGMQVVNMGLHGGLGNNIQTRIAMAGVKKGDIYVIAYSDYGQTTDLSQKDLTLIMLGAHKELWQCLTLKQKTELIPAIPDYMFNSLSFFIRGQGNEDISYEYSDYSRQGFNEYGDNTVRIDGNSISDFSMFVSQVPKVNDKTVEFIKDCKTICENEGATIVIACYPVMITEEMDDVESYHMFYDEVERKTGCSVISDVDDYFYSTDMFYDGLLHLNLQGARVRSEVLADEILEIMK